jgi:uncharacterized membrane protein (DUF4010 family)
MTTLELFQSAGVALAIGLLVGAERERAKHEQGSAGIRTFALAALLGNVATLVPVVVAALTLGGVVVAVAAGYVGGHKEDRGLTSELALLVTTALGALTRYEAGLAVAAAVATAVLLASKDRMHRFVRQTVTEQESADALKFFVVAFIVLPLLPATAVGPYDVWVPRRVWLLVVLITGIGWAGYAATRAFGARRGLLVAGLAGGFVSGTATIGTMGARYREAHELRKATLAGSLMASVATLVQIALLVTIADPAVAARLYLPLAAGMVVLVVEAVILSRHQEDIADQAAVGRPFALVPALILAAVISLVLLLATWLNQRYGASGALIAAAAGSLADTHASAVAVSTLAHQGTVSVSLAVTAVAVGLATNLGSKVAAAAVTGGRSFAGSVLLWHLPPALAIAAVLLASG